MDLKDPKVQRIIIGVMAIVGVSYMYFGTTLLPFFYRVRKAEIATMEAEYAKLNADLERARQTIGKLAQLEAEYERLHQQWLSAQKLLPEEQEMPDLLRQVTTAGNKSGIEFILFQPGAVVVKEDYKEHPVNIRVRGGYHQFGMFLSRLANMDRIVNIENLEVKSASKARGRGGKNEDTRNTVVSSFTLKAHTLIGGVHDETVAQTVAQKNVQSAAQTQ